MEELLKIDFQEQFRRMIQYFRIKMTVDQASITFDRVKSLPLDALMFAVDYFIDNSRPTPGGFPTTKELLNKAYEWFAYHPEEKFKRTAFDRVEDFTYPLQKLWDGYDVLSKQGPEAFEIFVNKNRMPMNDRERVWLKVKAVQNRQDPSRAVAVSKLVDRVGSNAKGYDIEQRKVILQKQKVDLLHQEQQESAS